MNVKPTLIENVSKAGGQQRNTDNNLLEILQVVRRFVDFTWKAAVKKVWRWAEGWGDFELKRAEWWIVKGVRNFSRRKLKINNGNNTLKVIEAGWKVKLNKLVFCKKLFRLKKQEFCKIVIYRRLLIIDQGPDMLCFLKQFIESVFTRAMFDPIRICSNKSYIYEIREILLELRNVNY